MPPVAAAAVAGALRVFVPHHRPLHFFLTVNGVGPASPAAVGLASVAPHLVAGAAVDVSLAFLLGSAPLLLVLLEVDPASPVYGAACRCFCVV